MSIWRKSTTHDLATLRLHPDGSRVQQSSINRKQRKALSTVPDARGNWIARDAGGRWNVSKTKSANPQVENEDGEVFDIRLSDDSGQDHLAARTNAKGKHKAIESDAEDSNGERTGKNFRARKRRSFTQDFSFLAPSPYRPLSESESAHEDNSSSKSEAVKITLPDPSPELLKCIHHFASHYYQEKNVLFDRKDFRGEKKAQHFKKTEANIHDQTTTKRALWTRDSPLEGDDDAWEDGEDDETEDEEAQENTCRQQEHLTKDMYKALDGSALVAIGIILQEQIVHVMTASFSSTHSDTLPQWDDLRERSSSPF